MAQRQLTQITDDLDGSILEEATTIQFSLEGVSFEIDLSTENAEQLRSAVAPFLSAARRTSGRRTRGNTTTAATMRDLGAIREWARSNGYSISDRGRVSVEILEAFDSEVHS